MDAVKQYIGIGHLDGIVEIEDTFVRASYKGRHTENSVFKMSRKAYKKGGKQNIINLRKRKEKEVLVRTK